jgi:hypothetical protein
MNGVSGTNPWAAVAARVQTDFNTGRQSSSVMDTVSETVQELWAKFKAALGVYEKVQETIAEKMDVEGRTELTEAEQIAVWQAEHKVMMARAGLYTKVMREQRATEQRAARQEYDEWKDKADAMFLAADRERLTWSPMYRQLNGLPPL